MVVVRLLSLAFVCCSLVLAGGLARRTAAADAVSASVSSAALGGTPRRPPVRVRKAPVRAGVPADPWWPREWGLARVGLPSLWRITTGAPAVVVAVVDTGVDTTSRDLVGAALPGHNVVDGSSDVQDAVGHGTMVAEVALARGNNRLQGTGVCWRCRLLPVKVAANGSTSGDELAAGIVWAADHGADVINLSLVLKGRDDAVEQAIAHAVAAGALVVASAGNDGGGAPSYPASYPGVIGVVGVDEHDHPYPWSTRGTWAALSAPGCAVVAAAGGSATTFCGSSAAAPVVSGVAALLLSVGLPVDRVRSLLSSSGKLADADVASAGRIDASRIAAALSKK